MVLLYLKNLGCTIILIPNPAQAVVLSEVKLELERKAMNYATSTSGLIQAAFIGWLASAQYLLSKGAEPNQVNSDDCIPLMWAAFHGHAEILNMLLAVNDGRTAGPNRAAIDDGSTALTLAVHDGHVEVVRALLEYQHVLVNIDQVDSNGDSA